MLSLLTGNPRKYEPLADLLAALQIEVRVPDYELLEPQHEDFSVVLAHKARQACEQLGEPCLVDDSGLWLDAYPGFPGPLTRSVCRLLGAAGLERLLSGVTCRARLVCHLGVWFQGRLWSWTGEVVGKLDPSRPVGDGPGPLTQWFVPDETGPDAVFLHRRRALVALSRDWAELTGLVLPVATEGGPGCRPSGRTESLRSSAAAQGEIASPGPLACVFCQEFAGHPTSVYHGLLGTELPSRIVHRTPHFLVFPPLGQFVEGGLLLATREHRLSMADLPDDYYDELERLVQETSERLRQHYGCPPLFFEHAPVAAGEKGTCCVDHAHLNVFPVAVDVQAQLERFPYQAITDLRELAGEAFRHEPYLFLQANSGERFVYLAGIVPSQYIRKLITAAIGVPERWHWREYLGLDELKRTCATLAGWR